MNCIVMCLMCLYSIAMQLVKRDKMWASNYDEMLCGW